MLHTIKFGELSAMLLDFVDSNDGFLYLRMVEAEPTVNAIWAKLSAKEGRGKKWTSEVQIPVPGRSYPERAMAQKGVTYRTLRTRLPSEMVDLAMVHPALTVAEDSEQGFYLLTYEDGVPAGFFERLNATLAIPLKPAWTSWLWEQGQRPQTRFTLQTKSIYEDGQRLEKEALVETTDIPIIKLQSLGQVACYSVRCHKPYQEAWLHLIRTQLRLGIRLKAIYEATTGGYYYYNGDWTVLQDHHSDTGSWRLDQLGHTLLAAPSLNYLLTEARERLGLHFILVEDELC